MLKTLKRKSLDRREERRLLICAKSGDKRAIEQVIEFNIGLISKEVSWRQTFDLSIDRDDLFQEGRIALWEALQKFDINRTYRDKRGRLQYHKFSTYATDRVRARIGRYLQNCSQTIRYPVYQMERLARLRAAEQRLDQRLTREPEIEELSAESGLSIEEIRDLLQLPKIVGSLDAPVHSDDYEIIYFGDITPDASSTTYQKRLVDREWLSELLQQLEPEERRLIEERVDWNDQGESPTQAELGARGKKKLSRSSIQIKEACALRKLRGYYQIKLEADSEGRVGNKNAKGKITAAKVPAERRRKKSDPSGKGRRPARDRSAHRG